MKIGNFTINSDSPSFIVAELSANHNQNKQIAIDTIRAAKQAGADAIKLQTYTPDTLTIDCNNDYFRIGHGTLWDGKTLYELYKEAYTPWEWHEELFDVAQREGLVVFSSPFDKSAVDLLERLNTPAYKIASFEIQDIPLIRYVAAKGKPVIISTGIASLADIELAVQTCRNEGNNEVILLKCTSAYPAPLELANLKTMVDMGQRFGLLTGLSDHTLGHTAAVVATALGGKMIEKHFILDKSIGGPDAEFSLDPGEFADLVEAVRSAEASLGASTYEISDGVEKNRKFARSLFVVENMVKGEAFTEKNVRSIRPGYGLHPRFFDEIVGRKTKSSLKKGSPLRWEDIE
jgi:pseudaminic acid synthase